MVYQSPKLGDAFQEIGEFINVIGTGDKRFRYTEMSSPVPVTLLTPGEDAAAGNLLQTT